MLLSIYYYKCTSDAKQLLNEWHLNLYLQAIVTGSKLPHTHNYSLACFCGAVHLSEYYITYNIFFVVKIVLFNYWTRAGECRTGTAEECRPARLAGFANLARNLRHARFHLQEIKTVTSITFGGIYTRSH